MKKVLQWRFVLPTLQLILAICLWMYIPFQFRSEMLRRMGLPPDFSGGLGLDAEAHASYSPPSMGRFLYIVDFPAYTLSNEVQKLFMRRDTPVVRFTYKVSYVFGVREVVFFGGVCGLWLWVGCQFDEFGNGWAANRQSRHLYLRSAEIIVLLTLAMTMVLQSVKCLTALDCYPPERSISTFGLIWPVVFAAYVVFAIRHLFRA